MKNGTKRHWTIYLQAISRVSQSLSFKAISFSRQAHRNMSKALLIYLKLISQLLINQCEILIICFTLVQNNQTRGHLNQVGRLQRFAPNHSESVNTLVLWFSKKTPKVLMNNI